MEGLKNGSQPTRNEWMEKQESVEYNCIKQKHQEKRRRAPPNKELTPAELKRTAVTPQATVYTKTFHDRLRALDTANGTQLFGTRRAVTRS